MYDNKLKRIFDFCLALICILLLSPIFLLVIIFIYLIDGGSPLYISDRVGKSGKIFKFFKFRTMPIGTILISSDKAKDFKIKPLGKFLRRFSIDELPQLWNILKGEMSFVGPRPALMSQNKLIELRNIHKVINCRPGLTGLAQINSFDGMSLEEKVKYDAQYASNVNFFLDLIIILKTFSYIMKPPPVY